MLRQQYIFSQKTHLFNSQINRVKAGIANVIKANAFTAG